jgi:hypothetical protein
MKKSLTLLLVSLLIAIVTAPASAWEFQLSGNFQWTYDYFAQSGSAGFFGPYNEINPSGNILGPPFQANSLNQNAWLGARTINEVQYGLVTGQDASFNYQRVELYPELRINPAIRLRGWYQIGSLIANGFSLYENSSAPGAWSIIDTGSWTQWWATAQTPWGIVVVGKRPLAFGIGAQYEGTSVTNESLLFVAPYGPLRFGLGIYPNRRQLWVNSFSIPLTGTTGGLGGPGRQLVSTTDGGGYQNELDHTSTMIQQPLAFVTYQAGSLDLGVLYEWLKEHEGPESANFNDSRTVHATRDSTVEDGCVYAKYNNGRFFFNSELAWVRVQTNYQPPLAFATAFFASPVTPVDPGDGGGSQYAPYTNEVWKFMTELGTTCGPAKVSFLYSWVPGPDRRHGIWINKQSWDNIFVPGFPQRDLFGNTQAFLPYSLLMSYQYGGGLNATNLKGEGYMTDASSWGARLDYAVAANLNVYASFFYATRVSKGWGWASLIPVVGGGLGPGRPQVILLGQNFTNANQNQLAGGAPSIPDDSLGWEVTAGTDWKLLEGLTWSARGAYWQPGGWFKFACVDKRFVTFDTTGFPTPLQGDGAAIGSAWGVNPNRSIDPIWGFQSNLVFDF